jgi:hypothetical protein
MSKFSAGKYAKAMCDRCGVEYKYTLLQLEWTGHKVCPECFDEKSSLEFPNNIPVDAEALMSPRPDTDVEVSEGRVSAKDISTGDTPIGTMFRGFEPVSAVGSVTVTIS